MDARTLEACPLAESVDVRCGQPGPGIVGWRETEAVGGVVYQRE